jgi:hypothetical protein
MDGLKFTPRIINEIEVEARKPVQDVLADFSLRTMVLFVKKGLALDEDKAFEAIETFLAGGKDTVELYTLIMEKLQEAGFLPRQLNLGKVKADMSKAISEGV